MTNESRADRFGRAPQGADRGYFSVMLGLLIVPLLLFAALAVDVGYWYTRSMELQRAADAAALAGVVWQPNDFGRAQLEAREAARRNGLVHNPAGASGINVDVQPIAGRSRELDVTITDPRVRSFFGSVVLREITMARTARARYVLPVPLGSPLNTFGNQNLTPSADDPKLWAAINGPYARHESGDPYAVKCAGDPTGVRTCGGPANTEYRPEGYRYIVDVPAGAAGRTLTVQTLDARFAPRTNFQTETGDGYEWTQSGYQTNRMALAYELFEADATPLDVTDNVSMEGRCTAGPGRRGLANNHSTSTGLEWFTLCSRTMTAATPVGQYVLTVKSSDIPTTTDQGSGSNQYSLRATLSGVGPQPKVYAFGDMSIFTNYNLAAPPAVNRSNNYLAEVEDIHAGKTLRVELFDAGDGSNGQFDLSIVGPDGAIPNCRYNSPASASLDRSGPCTIRTRNNGSSASNNLYNNRWLRIEVPIARTYTCNAAGATPNNPAPGVETACWWRLSYLFGGTNPTPSDRTTWRVTLIGDPVQLIR